MSWNSSGIDEEDFSCPLIGSVPVIVVSVIFGTSALIANMALMYSIKTYRKRAVLTPDKMFILSMIIADIIPCITSVPVYAMFLYKEHPVMVDNFLCLFWYYTMFIPHCVNIVTLAVLSFDRCEVVTSLPGQRRITRENAKYIVLFVWIFAIFSSFAGGSGYWIPLSNEERVCMRMDHVGLEPVIITNRVMLGIVCVWNFGSVGVIANRFYVIALRIRRHISMVTEVLGRSTVTEIKTTKISFAYTIAYAIGWFPYGVSVALRSNYSTPVVHCIYTASHLLSYSSFASVPIAYIIMDRALRKRFRLLFKKKNAIEVKPNSMSVPSSNIKGIVSQAGVEVIELN